MPSILHYFPFLSLFLLPALSSTNSQFVPSSFNSSSQPFLPESSFSSFSGQIKRLKSSPLLFPSSNSSNIPKANNLQTTEFLTQNSTLDNSSIPYHLNLVHSRALPNHQTSSTVLVIAPDENDAKHGTETLRAYGIPFQTVVGRGYVPIPSLVNGNMGNFGVIVVVGENFGINSEQWNRMYNYQVQFGVRMVILNAVPKPEYGTFPAADGACCGANIEHPIYLSDVSDFPTARIKPWARMSTLSLVSRPARITDPGKARPFAQFDVAAGLPVTTAAIINTFPGRSQMVFFMNWSSQWIKTSVVLDHVWIHWATRGVYTGFRRVHLGTQVDDIFLSTRIYNQPGSQYRIQAADLQAHLQWAAQLHGRLPGGSDYFIELGLNGNGALESAYGRDLARRVCKIPPITYVAQLTPTPNQEFVKPLGTGQTVWPTSPSSFSWNAECISQDPLAAWLMQPANRDKFALISHTFTHLSLDMTTFEDSLREVQFNADFFRVSGMSSSPRFSSSGIIPPAITGLHNGDALRAWAQIGLRHAVGDSSRPAINNVQNRYWPYQTTTGANGFANFQIIPRTSTKIFFDCDNMACLAQQWHNVFGGSGDWGQLVEGEINMGSLSLLKLYHSPFMFHQANLRYMDAPSYVLPQIKGKYSLLQLWVEVVTRELVRLTDWPIVSLKQDDLFATFNDRMLRDQCAPNMLWNYSGDGGSIVSVTATVGSGQCPRPIPITVPNSVNDLQGGRAEQRGSDPLTVWVDLSRGGSVTLTLNPPVKV